MPDHGQLLAGPFPVEDAKEARFYERALVLKARDTNSEMVCPYKFPMIGVPHLPKAASGLVDAFPAWQSIRVPQGWDVAARDALRQRLGLVPTGGGAPVQLAIGGPLGVDRPPNQPPIMGFPAAAQLEERTLYDVAVRGDDGQWHVVAPHAIYYRATWSTFGIAHATDLHVARRIDDFRPRLRQLGLNEAADKFYNWNDRFRGFIRYANQMHAEGRLDLILATGDVIDYQQESAEDAAAGGNAAFLRDLLLGRAPGPDFPDVEELRVPIFLTTGNHDYRRYPYPLIWEFDYSGAYKGPYGHYSGYHILREDAIKLNGGISSMSSDDAGLPVLVDRDMPGYRKYLSDRSTYMIELGKHRVAMLDAGSDIGIATSAAEVAHGELFGRTEDKQMFLDGNPRSQGPDEYGVKLLTDSLAAMPDDGLYIVGLHAPLINPIHNQYPYFLRETVRPENEDKVLAFLRRNDDGSDSDEEARERHPSWFAPERDHRAVRYVKRGDSSDMLDWGTSENDFTPQIVRRIAGAEGHRPADLVLHGHIHSHNEFRISVRDGELYFFFDFYTENPFAYYPTRFGSGGDDVTYVEVVDGAPARGQHSAMPYEAMHKHIVRTPPYANPLNSAADKRAWWQQHRPLILQTSCLTPLDNSQASFSGFRLIAVGDDVIQAIHYVSMDRIQAGGYRLPWAEAVATPPPRHHRHSQRGREIDAPEAAGSPFGYVSLASPGVDDVVYRAPNGHLMEIWRDPNGALGRGDLTHAAGARPAAGDPFVYVDPQSKNQLLLYRGDDGKVHALYWTTAEVGHDALSGSIGAPDTASRPAGYINQDGVNHVFYRGNDNGLHCLFWQGAEAARHEDLSRYAPGEPKAKGDPIGYVANGVNHVIFRGSDDHIRALYWSTGATGHDDLSGVAGSPPAAGDANAFFTPHDQAHQVHYRGTDGNIHELWWVGEQRVSHINLSALAGAPPAAADPASYYDPRTNTKHVYYPNAAGQLIELWWVPGQTNAAMVELGIWALAAPCVGRPHAWAGPRFQHVVYRGKDNQIHEIRW